MLDDITGAWTLPDNRLLKYIVVSAVGALSVVAWAPVGWWLVLIISYAVFYAWLTSAKRAYDALFMSICFSLAQHATGHGWVYQALHNKAGLSVAGALGATLFFISYLACFTVVPSLLYWFIVVRDRCADAGRDQKNGKYGHGRNGCSPLGSPVVFWRHALLFSALLTTGEWGRSYFYNAFTSLSLGYAFVDTWLGGFAPVVGLYGVSLAIAFIAALIGQGAVIVMMHLLSGGAAKSRKGIAVQVLCRLMCVLVMVATARLASQIQWVTPSGPVLSYRLIQNNVSQNEKFDPRFVEHHMRRLVSDITASPADLIITPETAFPQFLSELPSDVLPSLQDFARRTQSNLMLGVATSASNADGYNSVIQISPDTLSGELPRYDKERLMPFGEYTPWGFGWFSGMLAIPLKDLSSGTAGQLPFIVVDRTDNKNGTSQSNASVDADEDGNQATQNHVSVAIGTMICQEDFVGRDAGARARHSNLLINPSNLGWFQGSLAIAQRIQVVQMRALETGRPILRVANTGITAQIDAHGRVVKQLQADHDDTLFGQVQGVTGLTIYDKFGDSLILIMIGLIMIGSVLIRNSKRNSIN